eukprot:symbB.v1.2.034937.t1/scaffold4602.1/size37518/1
MGRAVENMGPEVLVVDEIGTLGEAKAARTIGERGVQLLATAHGKNLHNLIGNNELRDLIGGLRGAILSDMNPRYQEQNRKNITERASEPVFETLVEIRSPTHLVIHRDLKTAVDRLLEGGDTMVEERWLEDGQWTVRQVQENFEQRQFHVKAWGETMHGTIVDLPCRVESHLLPPEGLQVLYKSADVAQMLIVHREEKLPGSERHLDKRTFMWRSGLTPATQRVDQRFRGVPPSNSIFAPALIRETTTALKNRKDRNEFSYEEEVEVDEAFREKMEKEEPNSVWKPKDLPRQRERPGVEQGAPQKSTSLQRKGAASEVSLRSDAQTEDSKVIVKKIRIGRREEEKK